MIAEARSTENDGSAGEPSCVNLKQLFGKRYRVEYEESYYAEHGERARMEDPWLMIIRCQHGHICPWGGELLAACTNDSAPIIVKRLLALPFINHAESQLGTDGAGVTLKPVVTPTCGNVVFPIRHIEEVFAIMKPRRRRQLTEEQKRAGAERLARYRFKPAVQNAHSYPESTFCPSEDQKDQDEVNRPKSVRADELTGRQPMFRTNAAIGTRSAR